MYPNVAYADTTNKVQVKIMEYLKLQEYIFTMKKNLPHKPLSVSTMIYFNRIFNNDFSDGQSFFKCAM